MFPNGNDCFTIWTLVNGIRAAIQAARNQTAAAPKDERNRTASYERTDTGPSDYFGQNEDLAMRTFQINRFTFNRIIFHIIKI